MAVGSCRHASLHSETVCATARDIVLQHIWNERSATASQLSNLPEQLMADNQGNTNEDGIDMQGSDTAEVLLERFGYNIFLGGMYSVEDYRAM